MVLLKNGKKPNTPLLPLPKKTSKILVVGSHANNLGYQCGGWTISWQGQGGNNITVGMFHFIFHYSGHLKTSWILRFISSFETIFDNCIEKNYSNLELLILEKI